MTVFCEDFSSNMLLCLPLLLLLFQPKKFNEKKIKKKDLIHPRSRKADQVGRAKLRKQRLEGAHEKLLLRKNATGKKEYSGGGQFYILTSSVEIELVSGNFEGI